MKQGMTLQELMTEVIRRSDTRHDYLVPTDSLRMELAQEGEETRPIFSFSDNQSRSITTDINSIAHRQLGTMLNIPAAYYDRMMTESPALLRENVNTWMGRLNGRKMLRTLDGTARAVLSDRYRIIDNDLILATVLPELQSLPDLYVESCAVTDQKLYLKVVNPRLTADISVGDTVQAGMIISNSEVGMGSVIVQPLVYRLVCTNGMVVNDARTRKNHLGRSNLSDERYELYSDDTVLADNKVLMMKLRDTVRAVCNELQFHRVVDMMREAQSARIQAADIPAFVDLTAKEYALGKEESAGVLRQLITAGDLSLYGLANAVTRHSQDVESYDRASTLESIGYDILSMSKSTWNRLNRQAA